MTAITAEWLESVGFIVSDRKPVYWRFEIGDVWVAHCPATDRWWVDDVNWAGITVPNIHTRDDVRALVRMLGGELNESEETGD